MENWILNALELEVRMIGIPLWKEHWTLLRAYTHTYTGISQVESTGCRDSSGGRRPSTGEMEVALIIVTVG